MMREANPIINKFINNIRECPFPPHTPLHELVVLKKTLDFYDYGTVKLTR